MRFLTAMAAVVGLSALAHAHFVFVYVEGAEARVVFGHKAEVDPDSSSTRCEKTTLTFRDAKGAETKRAVEKGEGNFYRAKFAAGKPVVVYGITEAGVTQRGDNPAVLSWYYPKVIVGDPFTDKAAVSAALDIVPVRKENGVRFRVVANGKPVADAEVTVGLPGVDEDKMPVVKTDAEGLTTAFTERGQYCVAARRIEEKPGERDGKKYSAVRHTATLVFDFAPAAK